MIQPLPKISVITPSLNQGPFLRRTIESVLNQGYPNLEYFVLDGGSSDNSVEILQEFADRLTFWVSEPDGGQSRAINRGLEMATGDIVCYINSDDWYPPGALFEVARLFQSRPDIHWVIGRSLYQGSGGDSEVRDCRLSESPERWVGEGPWLPQASSFWSRQALESVGPFRTDMHYVFDAEFALRLLFSGYRPHCVETILAHRWLHDDCKTVSSSERFLIEEDRFVELFSSHLSPKQTRVARTLRLRAWMTYYRSERNWPKFLSYFVRLCKFAPRSAFSFLRSLIGERLKKKHS